MPPVPTPARVPARDATPSRRRRPFALLAAAALAASFVLSAAASAAPHSTALDALVTELEVRRDTAFSPPLDRTRAKQKAAVTKALKKLGKNSKSLSTDVATATAIIASLEKAYPSELGANPVASPLRDAVGSAVTDLRALVRKRLRTVSATSNVLPDGTTKTKLQTTSEQGTAGLDASVAESQPSRALVAIRNVDRSITKALRTIDKLPNGLGLVVAGEAVEPLKVTAVYETGTQRFVLTGIQTRRRPASYRKLELIATGAGQGLSFATATWTAGTSATDATVFSSTEPVPLTLTLFDLDTRRAIGNFSFPAQDGAQNILSVDGTSVLVKIVVQ